MFYTAPTAIRAFMRWGTNWPAGRDLSSLRLLGSVGEPINPEAWMWYHEHIGRERCPIVDTWWQTETGTHSDHAAARVSRRRKPGSATKPFPGIVAEIRNAQGQARDGRRRPARAHEAVARRCCAASTAIPSASCSSTGASGRTGSTSPATARAWTRTATTGCSAASTTC